MLCSRHRYDEPMRATVAGDNGYEFEACRFLVEDFCKSQKVEKIIA